MFVWLDEDGEVLSCAKLGFGANRRNLEEGRREKKDDKKGFGVLGGILEVGGRKTMMMVGTGQELEGL